MYMRLSPENKLMLRDSEAKTSSENMQFRDVLFRQKSDVSHADVLIRQESQVKLDGALNRAENLRSRGQQILNDAENINLF
jgi:hypothetical protein